MYVPITFALKAIWERAVVRAKIGQYQHVSVYRHLGVGAPAAGRRIPHQKQSRSSHIRMYIFCFLLSLVLGDSTSTPLIARVLRRQETRLLAYCTEKGHGGSFRPLPLLCCRLWHSLFFQSRPLAELSNADVSTK